VLGFLSLLSEALRCLRSLFSSFPFQSGVSFTKQQLEFKEMPGS